MIVHCIKNGDNPEFKQIYEQNDLNEAGCNDDMRDKAYCKILEEDLFFENNKQKLNLIEIN